MNKILEVRNLTKTIGKTKILDDISFEIGENKIVGLVGQNGAGKSTLLKTLVGLYIPTSGNVKINGYDLKKEYEKAMESVGCVIENPVMYDYLTGEYNLNIFKLMFKNISEDRIKEIVKLLSIENYKDKKLKLYSLGMKQRLGLAQALLNKPKLLILDEPTNGLDPLGISDLRKLLRSLNGVSILISSHLLSEIETICDEVIFIDRGRIIKISEIEKTKRFKFYVDDEAKAKILLCDYDVNDRLEVRADEEELPALNRMLLENNVRVFKISEKTSSLENEFLSIIGKDKND